MSSSEYKNLEVLKLLGWRGLYLFTDLQFTGLVELTFKFSLLSI